MSKFIPSLISPGRHFLVDVYKPQGRPAVMTASEVTVTAHGFTTIPTEDRRHRIPLGGNNTAKNRERAAAVMLADLVEKGWIAKEDACVSTD